MSSDKIFDLTAGVYFYFYHMDICIENNRPGGLVVTLEYYYLIALVLEFDSHRGEM